MLNYTSKNLASLLGNRMISPETLQRLKASHMVKKPNEAQIHKYVFVNCKITTMYVIRYLFHSSSRKFHQGKITNLQ